MKKLLILVDMQNDFITGSLGNAECRAVVPNVTALLKTSIEEGTEIVYTMDTHEENYMDTSEGRALPVEHCIRGTDGWQIIPELRSLLERTGARRIEKGTFGSSTLAAILENEGYDEIVFAGVCTDICVISNALLAKAFSPESTVRVVESCCAGVTPQSHKNALDAMRMCHIIVQDE